MDAKKNAYWIALGAAALLAAVFYAVVIAGDKNKRVADQTRALKGKVDKLSKFARIPEEKVGDPMEGLPVPQLVEYWEKRSKALKEQEEKILGRYRGYDEQFEKLFTSDRDKEVKVPNFVSELRSQVRKRLIDRYDALLGIEDKNWPGPAEKQLPIVEPKPGEEERMSVAQKQFNIAEALLAAAKEAQATAVTQIAFKEPAGHSSAAAAVPSKEPELVKRIGCEANFRIPFPKLAGLVAKLLASGTVIFEIAELHVEAVPFHVPALEPWKVFPVPRAPGGGGAPPPAAGDKGPELPGFDRDVYIGTTEQSNTKTQGKDAPPLEEPSVGVRVLLHALDFELGAAPGAEEKRPARSGGKGEKEKGGGEKEKGAEDKEEAGEERPK